MLLLFPLFVRCTATSLHGLTYPNILSTPDKRRKKERKWRHRVAQVVIFANRDLRVKHLVTQPGNAPKTRPSHLTTADEVNKVSEGLAFVDHKGPGPSEDADPERM